MKSSSIQLLDNLETTFVICMLTLAKLSDYYSTPVILILRHEPFPPPKDRIS